MRESALQRALATTGNRYDRDFSKQNNERSATLVTAGCAIWNIGLGFVL